jgi:hypothetical protein
MSINYNRAITKNCKTSKEYKVRQINIDFPPYWDEGVSFYPRHNRGTHSANPKLYSYQIRMYRTWKHSRKTQWK